MQHTTPTMPIKKFAANCGTSFFDVNSCLCCLITEAVCMFAVSPDTKSPNGKGYTVACVRLVNKEFKTEIDAHIVAFMHEFVGRIQSIRRLFIAGLPSDISGLEMQKRELKTYTIADANGGNAVTFSPSSIFGNAIVDQIITDCRRLGKCCNLQPNVATFLAMSQEMCQVHTPMGIRKCRNVCRKSFDTSNFCFYEAGNTRICLYARSCCLDEVCVSPHTRLSLPASVSNDFASNTCRAMLRSVGVFHPFAPSDVMQATRSWGTAFPLHNINDSSHGEKCLSAATKQLPTSIMVSRHPQIDDKDASVQGLLNLTDRQMRACEFDARRKQEQLKEKKRTLLELERRNMVDDVNSHLASIKRFPVKSLDELSVTCPQMVKAVLDIMNTQAPSRHALDIHCVQKWMNTVTYFMVDVRVFEYTTYKTVSSSQAYEFVSGLHTPIYGQTQPSWVLNPINLSVYRRFDKCQITTKAIRFFDSIDSESLKIVKSRFSLVSRLDTPTRVPNYEFNCKLYTHGEFNAMIDSVTKVLTDANEEDELIVLPDCGPKSTSARAKYTPREIDESMMRWMQNTFKLLSSRPSTKAVALDILGVTNQDICNIVEKEGCSKLVCIKHARDNTASSRFVTA